MTCRTCGRPVAGPTCSVCGTPIVDAPAWTPPPDATVVDADPTHELPWVDPYGVTNQTALAPTVWRPSTPAGQPGALDDIYRPGPARPPGAPAPGSASWGAPQASVPVDATGGLPAIGWTSSPQPRRSSWPLVIALVGLVAVAAVAGVFAQRLLTALPGATSAVPVPAPTVTVVVGPSSSAPEAASTSVPAPASSSAAGVQTTPAAPAQQSPEQQALDALQAGATAGRSQLDAAVVAHAWAAQLASKYVGINDPLQTTASGSHTFIAADIWAEHQTLQGHANGASVILADSRTYGDRKNANGQPYWRTVAFSPSFTDAPSVRAWCAAAFPGLSGTALDNQCMPVRF